MAAAHGATLDQAGCVRTSASASHNPYRASGSGSGKPIKKLDQRAIRKRDHAHHASAFRSCRSACTRCEVGVNLGDVIIDGDDIFGDGVNIAARIEALAKPGSVCISHTVYEHVKNKLDLDYRPLGSHRVKNIAEPVRAYEVGGAAAAASRPRRMRWPAVNMPE